MTSGQKSTNYVRPQFTESNIYFIEYLLKKKKVRKKYFCAMHYRYKSLYAFVTSTLFIQYLFILTSSGLSGPPKPFLLGNTLKKKTYPQLQPKF